MSTIQPTGQPSGQAVRVQAAIRTAAARTGMDFEYLMAQARVESALDPDARAPTSSAAGLYQFTRQTWLDTLERHGAEHGLGWAADAISAQGGRARITDPSLRQAIMDLRFDPAASALMAGEFAADNAAYLQSAIGRAPDETELYLAHFLGAGGARQFITAWAENPGQSAAALFPEAAAANRGVFYGESGARSLGEVREFFAAKLAASGNGVPGGNSWASGGGFTALPGAAPAPVAPRRASMAETLAQVLGPVDAAGGAAPAHVQRAYRTIARFGM